MKRYLLALSFALVAFQSLVAVTPASADFYSNAPTDITTFQNKLAESFAGVQCGSATGIGFSGNISTGTDQKNTGINSLFVTNKSLAYPCAKTRNDRSVTLLSGGKTYSGSVWGWGEHVGDDFADITSSLALPALPLFGNTIPQVGWWVDVATYAVGFGVQWVPTQITAVNLDNQSLLIQSTSPLMTNGGLVFASTGTFLGVASSALPAVTGFTTVVGSPRMCSALNTNGYGSLISCTMGGKRAGPDGIWTVHPVVAPSPSPTPTPEPSVENTLPSAPTPATPQYCILGGMSDGLCSDQPSFQYSTCGIGKVATLYYLNKKKYVKLATLPGVLDQNSCSADKNSYSYDFTNKFIWPGKVSPQMKVIYNALKGKTTQTDTFVIVLKVDAGGSN